MKKIIIILEKADVGRNKQGLAFLDLLSTKGKTAFTRFSK